jgi:polyisoprenoid-binding protein YceI
MQIWEIDRVHSSVGFREPHGDQQVNGKFNSSWHDRFGKDFSKAMVEVNIDPKTIDTDNERRDGHLKSPDFAADSLPEISSSQPVLLRSETINSK